MTKVVICSYVHMRCVLMDLNNKKLLSNMPLENKRRKFMRSDFSFILFDTVASFCMSLLFL